MERFSQAFNYSNTKVAKRRMQWKGCHKQYMRLVSKNQLQVIESFNVCKLHMNFPPSSKLIQKVMLLSSNHLQNILGSINKIVSAMSQTS